MLIKINYFLGGLGDFTITPADKVTNNVIMIILEELSNFKL